MYGPIAGITDTDEINFCPRCGSSIKEYRGDGTAVCRECDYYFGVVETEGGEGRYEE